MAIVTNNNKRYVHVKDIPKSFLKTKRIDPKSVSKTIPDEFKPHVITLNRRLVIDVDYLLSLPGVTLETLGIKVETTLVNETTGQSVSVDSNLNPVTKSESDVKSQPQRPEQFKPIVLADHEKFRSDDGVVCEVRCYGGRSYDRILFNLYDVAKMLGKDANVFRQNIITNAASSYKIIEHYMERTETNLVSDDSKYVLTFQGLLKVLFSSRTGCMAKYVDWVTKLVYTAQMGTQEQRIELAKELVGVNYSQAEMLLSGETPVPGVYLFHVGDNKYKFGRTNNIMRRFAEHSADYGINTRLVTYARIERYFIKELDGKESLVVAEDKLKELLKELRIKVDHRNELIECDDVKEVLPLFSAIRKEFGKTYEEIVQELKDELKDAKHENELMSERHKNELKDKDIEKKDQELEHQKQIIELLSQINNLKIN